MENFNLKKYLAEGKLLKEDVSEYEVGDKVKFNPSTMKDKGFEDLQQYYGGLIGVIEKVSQDELEIKLNKSITPPGGGNIDGILLMKSEGDYEMLAEGKLLKEDQEALSPQSNKWLEGEVNMYFGGANEPGEKAEFEITRIEQGDPQKYDDADLAQQFLEEMRGLRSIVVRYDDYIGDIKVTSDREGDAIVTWTWPS